MAVALKIPGASRYEQDDSQYAALLQGYRFTVCSTRRDAERALEIRRRVYVDETGYDISVPDEYDGHSWILLAEDAATGQAVGTMRITSRSAGPLEAEEYFRLPATLRGPRVVEISRLAIVPEHRKRQDGSPWVAFGLFKAMAAFVRQTDVQFMVVCAKPERAATYAFLCFRPTGVKASYTKLRGAQHELLFFDLRHGFEPYDDHEMFRWFFLSQSPEVEIPTSTPRLGVHDDGERHRTAAVA